MKERLNGYWYHKTDKNSYVYVEKVFKKGYVTGFLYTKVADGTVHGKLHITQEELLKDYTRVSIYGSDQG